MATTHPAIYALSVMGGLAFAALILAVGIAKALERLDDWLG